MPRHALALLVQHCALVHARDVVRDAGAADEAACAIAALLGAAEAVGAAQEGEEAEEEAEEEGEAAAGLPAAVDEQLAADVFGASTAAVTLGGAVAPSAGGAHGARPT